MQYGYEQNLNEHIMMMRQMAAAKPRETPSRRELIFSRSQFSLIRPILIALIFILFCRTRLSIHSLSKSCNFDADCTSVGHLILLYGSYAWFR